MWLKATGAEVRMFVEDQDLVNLLEVQQIDLQVMQSKKKRAELPQRIEVMRLRKKRDEVQQKLDQVIELQKKAEHEMTLVEDEDRSLLEKQQRAQEIIDTAGSDYRRVESNSKEMAGVAKRRETLSHKADEIAVQLDKILGLRSQLEGAIAASQAEEDRLRNAFSEDDRKLVESISALMARRGEIVSQLPEDLFKLYEKTAAKTGGVAVGRLTEGGICGVCRTAIEEGRLIEVKAAAPLAVCPTCKRLLVVE